MSTVSTRSNPERIGRIRLQALSISLLPLSAAMAACYQLLRIFSLYEKGQYFDRDSIRRIRILGYLIFGWLLASKIYEPLITFCLSMANPSGHRFITLSFTASDIAILVTAAIVILISWVQDEARKLKEEQAHTI